MCIKKVCMPNILNKQFQLNISRVIYFFNVRRELTFLVQCISTVEPRYNEVLGTMKITLLYQVSHYIRVKEQRTIESWDQQNDLVIRGFCYIQPLYNEVPLYYELDHKAMTVIV